MTEADLPLPLPLLLGLLTLGATIAGALLAGFTKKWRTPADDREDRKIGIEADERLLARFEKMLSERDQKIDHLEERLTEIAMKVETLLTERNVLIDWIYAAVRVVRDLGAISRLPRPPKGVYIADHPSNDPSDVEV